MGLRRRKPKDEPAVFPSVAEPAAETVPPASVDKKPADAGLSQDDTAPPEEQTVTEAPPEDTEPTGADLIESGFIPEEQSAPPAPDVPSLETVTDAGYSEKVAKVIVEKTQEIADVIVRENARGNRNAAYKITATKKRGFWRIGRHFTLEPKYILVSTLSDEEIRRLEATPPFQLAVEMVELDDEG